MTGLNDQSLSHLRRFNYRPSLTLNGVTRWLDRYDAGKVRAELVRGKELFPWINTIRLWLSHDAWMDDRKHFSTIVTSQEEQDMNLRCIRRDGTLRTGHDAVNAVMNLQQLSGVYSGCVPVPSEKRFPTNQPNQPN